MAYVGNTARLCQAIVDGDVEHVTDWLSQEGADPNMRDYTGRTPLQLAAMSSTPEVVRALVDAGARLVARLADGRTALHLAAARGHVEIVKILLDKSTANEAEFEEKQDQRRREKSGEKSSEEAADQDENENKDENKDGDEEESDGELVDDAESDDGVQSMATGSFVKVGKKEAVPLDDVELEEDEDEPDFYDINVIAWDRPCSALHFAIIEGHVEVVKTLVQVCNPLFSVIVQAQLLILCKGIWRRCPAPCQVLESPQETSWGPAHLGPRLGSSCGKSKGNG